MAAAKRRRSKRKVPLTPAQARFMGLHASGHPLAARKSRVKRKVKLNQKSETGMY